jgi:tetratricopeptide (TPR) repeat protein
MGRPSGKVSGFILSILVALVRLPGFASAQSPANTPGPPAARADQPKPWYTLGRVSTLAGSPVAGAEVAVYIEPKTTPEIKMRTGLQGEFEISMQAGPSENRRVKVVARREGFLDATETADPAPEGNTGMMELVLRVGQDENEDLDQLSLRDLTLSVAEKLRASSDLSPAAPERSETLRAVEALLKAGDSDGALKILAKAADREPPCVEFLTLRALAMLQAGSWSGASRQLARSVALNTALEPKNRKSEPNLILGVMESWRGNPQKASELFRQALEVDPPSFLLFQELGRAETLNQNWSEAEAYFARALQSGAAPEAHMLRAKAFMGDGKLSEAQAELGACLGKTKPKNLPMAPRMFWMKLNDRLNLQAEAQASPAKPVVKQTLDELLVILPELQGLEPAKGQDELPAILQKVGERVEAFFYDFHNSTSREEIREERLNHDGKATSFLNQKFQYWLLNSSDLIHPSALQEYRTGPKGNRQAVVLAQEGLMLTEGFASVSQLFLPEYQRDSAFTYLGRQTMDGHQTYVLAFAQRPEVARQLGSFRDAWSNAWALTLSQGVVWIDCDTYQIIRLRTDLLNPLPKVRLARVTTDIQFGEVHFNELSNAVWLPHEVVVTVESNGKLRRNRHAYSDYRMFNVESKIIAVPDSSK